LQGLIAKHGLQRVSAEIEQAIRPAIHVQKQTRLETIKEGRRFFGLLAGKQKKTLSAMPLSAGSSHLGGRPDVGPGFQWPRWKDKPLGFLGQINCAEVAALDPENLWPKTGSLCFFYAIADCPWAGEPGCEGSWAVIHVKESNPRPAELPPGMDEDGLLPAYPASLRRFSSLPDSLSVDLSDEEFDSFYELRTELKRVDGKFEAAHQTLGHPDAVQGPVEDEWDEIEGNSVRPSNGSDWKLLLQFDSDDDLNVMWGDAGMLYFGIREAAFRAQRFEETQLTWQCC
jgi:uncharacterized protein YwqG